MLESTKATKIEVKTDDGIARCWVTRPKTAAGPLPGLLMYPDAGSVRPVTVDMAARAAELGYVVLQPEMFYRAGDYPPFDPKTVFSDPPERERLMKLIRSLDNATAMRDAKHWLRALSDVDGVRPGPVGTFGYCMGGRLAFATAGAHPDRVAAVACHHGGGLATDAEDSPHLSASKIQARLYFGVADADPSCPPAMQARLVEALATHHLRFSIDHFAKVSHGYAVPDFPVFDAAAAERHWARMAELFAGVFQPIP